MIAVRCILVEVERRPKIAELGPGHISRRACRSARVVAPGANRRGLGLTRCGEGSGRAHVTTHRCTGLCDLDGRDVEPRHLAGQRTGSRLVEGRTRWSARPIPIARTWVRRGRQRTARLVGIDPDGNRWERSDDHFRDRRSDEVCRVRTLVVVDFVDQPIAIVVDAIALLRAATGIRGAAGPRSVACSGCSGRTRVRAGPSTCTIARIGIGIVAGAGLSEIRDVFIEQPVAIVIECVARFVVARAAARAYARGESTDPRPARTRERDARRAFWPCRRGAHAAKLHR